MVRHRKPPSQIWKNFLRNNVTTNPTADWTAQQIVEAFPWDSAPRYLLRDRDKIFGSSGRVIEIGHIGGLHHHDERAAA